MFDIHTLNLVYFNYIQIFQIFCHSNVYKILTIHQNKIFHQFNCFKITSLFSIFCRLFTKKNKFKNGNS